MDYIGQLISSTHYLVGAHLALRYHAKLISAVKAPLDEKVQDLVRGLIIFCEERKLDWTSIRLSAEYQARREVQEAERAVAELLSLHATRAAEEE